MIIYFLDDWTKAYINLFPKKNKMIMLYTYYAKLSLTVLCKSGIL